MLNVLKLVVKFFFIFLLPIIFCVGCSGGGGDGGDVDVDTTPPPVPTGLTATAVSASRIDVSWTASADAEGYKVYRNGTFYLDVFGARSIQDIGVIANTTYNYRVSAFDSAGNESAQSALASATTLDTATVLLGTAANDYARGVALDSSGNVYVSGWTAGALDGQPNPNGADIFLTKYNVSGVRQWTRLLGTTGVTEPFSTTAPNLADYGLNVAVDSTRSYVYVTGYTTASMDGQTMTGSQDLFLVRYDLNGNNKQTRLFAYYLAENAGNSVAVDLNGNVYVAAYSRGTTVAKDIILIKYDSSLTIQNFRVYDSNSGLDDVATAVAVSADGNAVYVTGLTSGVLPQDIGSYSGGGDLFLAKFNAVPDLQWTTYLGSSELDAGLAICMDGTTVKVAGVTAGALPGKTNAGGNDVIVASFDSNGALLWSQQFGTPADDSAFGIVVDSIGNPYVTGFTSGNLSPFKPNAGLEDQFMARLSIGGAIFSYTMSGTSQGDEARGIAIRESDDLLYTVGFTGGNLDGEPYFGGIDASLLKFNLAGEQQ